MRTALPARLIRSRFHAMAPLAVVTALALCSCQAAEKVVTPADVAYRDAFSRCAYTDFGFAPGRIDASGRAAITEAEARSFRASWPRGSVIVFAFADQTEDTHAIRTEVRLAEARRALVVRRLNAAGIGVAASYAVTGYGLGMASEHSTAQIFMDCRGSSG